MVTSSWKHPNLNTWALSNIYSKIPQVISMVSEPRKRSRAAQFILHVLVLHNLDTKTRYFHILFLKEIFLLNCLLQLFYWTVSMIKQRQKPVFKKRGCKQILICKVEAHFIFFSHGNLETKTMFFFSCLKQQDNYDNCYDYDS